MTEFEMEGGAIQVIVYLLGTSIYSKYENETQKQHSIAQYFFVLR